MKKTIGLLIGLFLVVMSSVHAEENAPSLDLKLDAPVVVALQGQEIKVEGKYEKDSTGVTALAIGSQWGCKFPAPLIFSEKGTIIFSLKFQNPKPENSLVNRHLLTLRPEARQFIGFYLLANNRKLTLAFEQLPEIRTLTTRQDLEPGKWYRVACTWDGTTVKYYLDGELQGEMTQSFVPAFPSYTHFTLGPYVDNLYSCEPWKEDSCFLSNLKVWKRALSVAEMAGDAGKVIEDVDKKYPAFVSVPQISQPPVMDGKIDEPAWQQASSFVSLADVQFAAESLTYEANRPLFLHDGKNLYVAFQTIFPNGVEVRKGDMNDKEVWPNESFELYLYIDGKLYRFAGNPAGAACGKYDIDGKLGDDWKYFSNLSYRIDNRWHWQGEIVIPFALLGLSNPVGKEFKMNFCRTWCASNGSRTGITSLAINQGSYSERKCFATMKISDSSNACQTQEIKNPNFGDFENKLRLTSALEGKFQYQVDLISSENPSTPFELIKQVIDCKVGESKSLAFNQKINMSSGDRILFKVTDTQGNLLLQQLVPYKLTNDYIEVIPVFGQGKVLLKPRYAMLKEKLGGQPARIQILTQYAKTIYTGDIASDAQIAVTFDKNNPAGDYRVLVSLPDKNNTVLTNKTFFYPGLLPWETTSEEEVEVLPPFEPMKAVVKKDQLTAQMWGRSYTFNKSLLPTAIVSQHQMMLAGPVELNINGQPVAANDFKVEKNKPGRIDFTATASNPNCVVQETSFLEYDGILFNNIRITAKKQLDNVKLVVPIPKNMAKFVHVTKSGFGAGERTNANLDRDVAFDFNPVTWVGEQEHGISFFTESDAGWKSMPEKPIKVLLDGNRTLLEVTFATKVSEGEELNLEFGLIATPVRPLPTNYPLNIFGDHFAAPWNPAPPRAPVTYAAIDPCVGAEGQGFFDLPLNDPKPDVLHKWFIPTYESMLKSHAIFTPYMSAMFLEEEYPEAKANMREWEKVPSSHQIYKRGAQRYQWEMLCPVADARKDFAWRFGELLKRYPLHGIYFDFGACVKCNNALHGCHDRYPIMAMRDFYRRIAAEFVHSGVKDYVIVIHNSQTVQVPVITHVTHLLNGENLRQMSSSTFHFGKDILDTYTPLDFASEHSSLTWGVTSNIYLPTDPLLPEYGGGKEDQELYRFRMTKAVLAGSLVHNTFASPSRGHHGWYDKVVRIYDAFGVPKAEFLPYWRNTNWVKTIQGKDIYVSLYRSKDKPQVLAVISHLGKEHLDQDVSLEFNPSMFGVSHFESATEMLTANDPEYDRLYAEKNRWRVPVKLGDFGVSDCQLHNNLVSLKLKFHSVAIVRLDAKF